MKEAVWRRSRRFGPTAFPPDVLAQRGDTRIAVCLPARDESATITKVLEPLVAMLERDLVDRVLVADAGSRDQTARLARMAGAEVLDVQRIRSDLGPVLGKGDTVWRGLTRIHEDVIVWLDSDLEGVGDGWVSALAGPLLAHPEIQLVKGSFRRPMRGAASIAYGGGRVTELTARPLLLMFYPELAMLGQPLSGQVAARRRWVAEMPLYAGYGLEMGMLLESWSRGGLDVIAESDLGTLLNRHQPLSNLVPMAVEVLAAVAHKLASDRGLHQIASDRDLHAVGATTIQRPPVVTLDRVETVLE
jgi:glucosyl-3-phosphoglycerate synthase